MTIDDMRILFDVIFLLSAFLMPFWLLIVMAIIGLLFFPYWYEFIVVLTLYELIFRGGNIGIVSYYTIVPLPLYAYWGVLLVEYGRTRVREQAL